MIAHKLWHVRGGVERYVINLANTLTARGHDVIPFTCAHPANLPTGYERYYPKYRDLSGVRFNGDAAKAAVNILYSAEARRAMESLLDENPLPDVVHCRNIYHHLSPSILRPLRQRGIPVVMTVADYKLVCPDYKLFRDNGVCEECRGGRYWKAVRHRCVKRSFVASTLCTTEAYAHEHLGAYLDFIDLVVAPSEFVRDTLVRFGVPQKKVSVLNHFVDSDEWSPEGLALDAEFTRPYFVCFGRLSEEKGIRNAIEAIALLPSHDLVVVGEGPEEVGLRALAATLAPGRVRFLGHQLGDSLRPIVAGSSAVIMPSIWYEVFGFTILEAFALARPVIGSRIGAIPELVSDGETGLTFTPGDSADLASKMATVAADTNLAEQMGQNARELAETEYSPNGHYAALMRIYESVMK